MTFAVLPVKSPADAKRRLAGLFTAEERAQLAWLLFRNTLGVLLSVERLERVIVVSSDPRILNHARGEGADILAESVQQSHSNSADQAAAECEVLGAAGVLLVPIDVPLLGATDIEEVLCAAGSDGAPEVVIVPSAGGTGTNALLQMPPAAIPCRFGLGSFGAHRREAAQRGVAVTVASPPGLTFDLDEPEDVISLMNRGGTGAVSRYLGEISAAKRAEAYLSRQHLAEQSRT